MTSSKEDPLFGDYINNINTSVYGEWTALLTYIPYICSFLEQRQDQHFFQLGRLAQYPQYILDRLHATAVQYNLTPLHFLLLHLTNTTADPAKVCYMISQYMVYESKHFEWLDYIDLHNLHLLRVHHLDDAPVLR